MSLKDWFSRKSPLQLALERGLKPDADLPDELRALGDYTIRTPADATALCDNLERYLRAGSTIGGPYALRMLLRLFTSVDPNEHSALSVMLEQGNTLLLQIVNEAFRDPNRHDVQDVLDALFLLALNLTSVGTDAVIRASLLPFQPDEYRWLKVMEPYTIRHPERKKLFRALSDPLPDGFLAIALLDSANAAKREGAKFPHPFNSAQGVKRLERYLTDRDAEHFSYAASATEALPFIRGPARVHLLALAFDHPDPDVQTRAARKSAERGGEAGIKWLTRACLDVNLSDRAKGHLTDLGRADAIPPEAKEKEFEVLAHFADWLADPRELGKFPDELEIFDRRVLNWPPDRKPIEQWLVRFRATMPTWHVKDVRGIGLVGSLTFSFIAAHELEQRPPDDCYAVHCYWEMQQQDLISETRVEEDSTEYNSLLEKCPVDGLRQARIQRVAEVSPKLQHPGRVVALADGFRNGERGWVAIDGPRSRWYSASEMPSGTTELTVLMVHVGRAILGFTDEPDRHKYLSPSAESSPPTNHE